jgi:hypothetical protein
MDRAPVSPSRLPFASAVLEQAAALHSSLALMSWVAGLAGLPKLLCVVSNRVCSGYVNCSGSHD